jgi:hypothetical protein
MRPKSYSITEEEKQTIREYYNLGITIRQLSVMFKVSKTRIIKILKAGGEIND